MKLNYLFSLLIIVCISSLFSSCAKDNTNTTPTNNNNTDPFYINFDLDGVAQSYGATTASTTGGRSSSPPNVPHDFRFTGSFIPNLTTSKSVEIYLRFGKDSIVEADLMSLVGQKIPIGDCSTVGCTRASMRIYNLGMGGSSDMTSTGNSFPANFVEIDDVAFYTTGALGIKVYSVSGTFNVLLSDGTTSQAATNGTFKLLFPEIRQ